MNVTLTVTCDSVFNVKLDGGPCPFSIYIKKISTGLFYTMKITHSSRTPNCKYWRYDKNIVVLQIIPRRFCVAKPCLVSRYDLPDIWNKNQTWLSRLESVQIRSLPPVGSPTFTPRFISWNAAMSHMRPFQCVLSFVQALIHDIFKLIDVHELKTCIMMILYI